MASKADRAGTIRGNATRPPSIDAGDVDYGLLAELTGFSLKLVWILGRNLLAREFEEYGVTPHRFSVLEVIGRNPGLQQGQLAAALALSRPATTPRNGAQPRASAGIRSSSRRSSRSRVVSLHLS